MIRALTLLCTGCVYYPLVEEEPAPPVTVSDLWEKVPAQGTTVTVAAVVTSPSNAEGTHFYVADEAGGPRSGVRVVMGGVLSGWPAPVGSPVEVRGSVQYGDHGPRLDVSTRDDLSLLGAPVPPVVTDWTPDLPDLGYALVRSPRLQVVSHVEPSGLAATDIGLRLGGAFMGAPGWGARGRAVGILTQAAVLDPRTSTDWVGSAAQAPLPGSLSELRAGAYEPGTPLELQGLARITPWSRDGRQAVLQDEHGRGIWLDNAGWSFDADAHRVGTWVASALGSGPEALLLGWDVPTLGEEREASIRGDLADGALAWVDISGLVDEGFGEWSTAEGHLLDDRFRDLSDLPDPATVLAAVRRNGDEVILAVLPD
jgi:hypothetical protein